MPEDPALQFAYMTCADVAEAERIGRHLVQHQLAACINIMPGMTSIYRWEGAIESAHEVVVIAKTTTQCADALVAAVRSQHSYKVPCVVFLPITTGNPDYLAWLRNACRV